MSDIFCQGWTERIRYALTQDGSILNLNGLSVALVGDQTINGQLVPIAFLGTVGIDDANNGIVCFDPATGDLLASSSPYLVRWQITDGLGHISFYPRLGPIQWVVSTP
jgi:hypothetical protein